MRSLEEYIGNSAPASLADEIIWSSLTDEQRDAIGRLIDDIEIRLDIREEIAEKAREEGYRMAMNEARRLVSSLIRDVQTSFIKSLGLDKLEGRFRDIAER